MEIKIVKGNVTYLEDCEEALQNSELGRKYFASGGSARSAIIEGLRKDEIYTAVDSNGFCVGFLWIIWNGAFHSYPYLHIVAVKEEYRSQGIGKILLKHFEDFCFQKVSKVFLVFADFNPRAKKLYESLGYTEIGPIPDLYRVGITEYLMMKVRA
jgi:ribosomal protein S18 acetylase RimI-like enzyme